MTGREMIKWIKDNKAEDLELRIRHIKPGEDEVMEVKAPEIKFTIVGTEQQQYKKYFLI